MIFGHGMLGEVLWVRLLVRNGFCVYGSGFGTDGAGNGTVGSLYDTQKSNGKKVLRQGSGCVNTGRDAWSV